MKKYLLTVLLGVFGLFGFVSADSVDGFTSDTDIIKYHITQQSLTVDISKPSGFDESNVYLCVYSSPSPYTIYYDGEDGIDDTEYLSSSSVYCFPKLELFFNGGDEIGIYKDYFGYDNPSNVFQDGYLYLSNSPITYSSSSGGGGDSGGSLLPGGEGDLSGIISGLNSVIDEFLPYLVYIGLGLITSTIGFIAVRWLVGRTSSKVRGTFSSGKRRR